MARFLKHIGKHGDRKVAILFRQVPGEDHMCLVVYTELLNQNIHDPLMAALESPSAQQTEHLADALNKAYTKNGQIILQSLHREGMIKKIQTNQVTVTPAPNQHIKLNELNSLLDEMAKGEEAIKRLAEIDASRGLQDPKDVARRMREAKGQVMDQTAKSQKITPTNLRASQDGALGDDAIIANLREQAARMEAEAQGLLAEAQRLKAEASSMSPVSPESLMENVVSVEANNSSSSSKPKKSTRQRKAAVTG